MRQNMISIMQSGILPGSEIADDIDRRHESGRLHSYYGIFAPWDPRNSSTKMRVARRNNERLPLAVFYRTGFAKEEKLRTAVPSKRYGFAYHQAGIERPSNSLRRSMTRSSKMNSSWTTTLHLFSLNSREKGHLPESWNCSATCQQDHTRLEKSGCCAPLRQQWTTAAKTLVAFTT